MPVASIPKSPRASRAQPPRSSYRFARPVAAADAVMAANSLIADLPRPQIVDALLAAKSLAVKLDAIILNQVALNGRIDDILASVYASDVNLIRGSAYLINYYWSLWMAYLRVELNDDPWSWNRPDEPIWL